MSPRFDRRRDEGQGTGSGSGPGAGGGARSGGSGRPARPGKPSFGASRFSGGGGRSFGPRPEWRAEGPPERGARPERGSRPERGPRPERSGGSERPRFDRAAAGRPAGGQPRPDRFRSERPDRPRFAGGQPEGGRPEGPRFAGGRAGGPRPSGARPGMVRPGRPRLDGPRADKPRFDKPRFDSPRFDDGRPEGRSGEGGGADVRPAARRFDGRGAMGEGRPGARRPFPGRPFAGRPDGPGRRERPSAPFGAAEGGAGGRISSSRPEGRRFAGAGASRGSYGRPSFGRPAFGGAAPGRPPFPQVRSDRPVLVDAASGEAETFGSSPADDMIWGRHPALAALESGRPIHRIWCTAEMRFTPKFLQLLREAKAGGVLVEEVTWARLGQLTGGAVHQGIALQAAAAETLDLDSLISGCREIGEPPLLMAVDGLTDPHNLGAIVRSAEALGAHGLVLPQRRSAGLTGSVAKVAAGALEHLPVARVVNLNRSLDTLKQEGYRVVGLAEEGSVTLAEADLDGPLVVVTGSEGNGLSMLTRRHCDQLVRIPLRGATPSLNASVATALLLYEVARRGWMKTITGSSPAPRIVRPNLPTPSRRVVAETEPGMAIAEVDLAVAQVDLTVAQVAFDLAEAGSGDAAIASDRIAAGSGGSATDSAIGSATELEGGGDGEPAASEPELEPGAPGPELPSLAANPGADPEGEPGAAPADSTDSVSGTAPGAEAALPPPQAPQGGDPGDASAAPSPGSGAAPESPVAADPLPAPESSSPGQEPAPPELVLGLQPELAGGFEQDIRL